MYQYNTNCFHDCLKNVKFTEFALQRQKLLHNNMIYALLYSIMLQWIKDKMLSITWTLNLPNPETQLEVSASVQVVPIAAQVLLVYLSCPTFQLRLSVPSVSSRQVRDTSALLVRISTALWLNYHPWWVQRHLSAGCGEAWAISVLLVAPTCTAVAICSRIEL